MQYGSRVGKRSFIIAPLWMVALFWIFAAFLAYTLVQEYWRGMLEIGAVITIVVGVLAWIGHVRRQNERVSRTVMVDGQSVLLAPKTIAAIKGGPDTMQAFLDNEAVWTQTAEPYRSLIRKYVAEQRRQAIRSEINA